MKQYKEVFEITNTYSHIELPEEIKTGKEKRRERRKLERNRNKFGKSK